MSATDDDRTTDADELSSGTADRIPGIVPASGDWNADDDPGETPRPTTRVKSQPVRSQRPTSGPPPTKRPPTAVNNRKPVGKDQTQVVDRAVAAHEAPEAVDEVSFVKTKAIEAITAVREYGLDGRAQPDDRARRKPRVRKVTRVIRHIDPWSTFKVGLLFSLFAYFVCLTSGVLLWRVADSTGTVDNVERWFTQFGWETFEFKGDKIFDNAWVIGLFLVVAATGGMVLLATIFNLVSDVIGGIRVTVLEEEVIEDVRRPRRRSTRLNGSGVEPTTAEWSLDD